jgi:hypothetical protein
MTAKGKINASKVQINDRIIVKVSVDGTVGPSATKTGEGVQVARVIDKGVRAAGPYEARGKYVIETSAGSFEAAPIQTMWLAPEDAAGIKRAYAEAVDEENERNIIKANDGGEADMNDTETLAVDADLADAAALSPWLAGKLTQHIETLGADNDAHLPVAGVPGTSLGEMREAFKDEDETPEVVRELTGSAVVKLLERVHERIRQNHPEVPEVVIVTGAGIGMGSSNKWGHFRPQGWITRDGETSAHVHEMFMAGETLAKGAHQVLQTMLHESAHALAEHRGEKDTSRQGRWHNQVFLKTAKELGLEYRGDKADKALGFSAVTLTPSTITEYADLIDELEQEICLMVRLPGWLGGSEDDQDSNGGENMGKAPKGTETKSTSNVKLTCLCEEPNIIRASKKVADKMVVRCDDCEELFTEKE